MKKILIIGFISVFVLSACSQSKTENQTGAALSGEQAVYEQTYDISKRYVALRYRTDNVLINAEQYSGYDDWNNEMTAIINDWKSLEESAAGLERSADAMAQEKTGFLFARPALAYDKAEISRIVDKAPMGKKIMTLAKHLGVDAKRAQLILNQDQAMVSSEIWGGEGDTFETMEKSAIVVKDGCKVAGFVGGVVLSGGTSAIMAGSVLTKAAVIVSGADLVLEVTEDGANIALGNDNQVSAIVGDARKVTGPIATILTITDIPNNLSSGFDKFNAVMAGLDQFRSAAQDGNVLGINLPVYAGENSAPISVAVLKPEEVGEWLKENGKETPGETVAEVEKILEIGQKNSEQAASSPAAAPETAPAAKTEESAGGSKPRMPIAEYKALDEDMKLGTMAEVTGTFGQPDHSTTGKNGRTVYVYFDRLENSSGNLSSLRITFYTLDDYKAIAESAFGWNEDYQEIWDASGGGLTASKEIRSADTFKSEYGL